MVSRDRILIIDLEDSVEFQLDIDGIKGISNEDGRWYIIFDPSRIHSAELVFNITSRYNVRDIFIEDPPIEEIIAKLYAELNI